jgi:hypothetical protein
MMTLSHQLKNQQISECRVQQVVHIRTPWRYMPEDGTIRNYRFENLKSILKFPSVRYFTASLLFEEIFDMLTVVLN